MELNCKNCQALLSEDSKFCSQCGQSIKSTRQPLIPFIKESVHELLDIDGRLSRTLKTLCTKPGLASYEYEHGMRAKYTPPLRLYLVVSVIFFLLFSTFQQFFIVAEDHSASSLDLYSKAMFILFPLFALYVKALYPNSYMVSNIVFSLHVHTMSYLVLILMGPLEVLEQKHSVFLLLQAPILLYALWYFITAFKTMYQASWWVTILKSGLIYLVYMATMGVMFDVVLGK
ncbi:hypothetical protein C1E24_18380 [Pseudoalteromonas phenolica]|uniref:DUF3667 domain-containing protein n=1 Tax=Pseudoalteromonas phenolica TaxID=161398 RepID=A0A5R9PXB4_9GAMM|nr:DUF3667 domain-containing protein [Pseudoalteromonas phenolica]TLX45558.1 hypothetical protein C1E24_18380 [Pseudoalteromonas phenolica]